MPSKTPSRAPVAHHRVRTFFASAFGLIALWLILSSVLVVWLNRTLTDTNTYVTTVAPLVSQPAIQSFIVNKATDQLLQSAPTEDLAKTLLPDNVTSGKDFDQLTALVRPVISDSFRQIVSSAAFASLWKTTNQTAHAQLIAQLKAKAPVITLDLSPAVTGAIDQLKLTKLAAVSDKIEIKPGVGKFDLKGGSIEKIERYYGLLQTSMLALLGLTLLCIVLAVLISVHHMKTVRRILMGTALSSLLVAGLLEAPALIKFQTKADPDTQAAAIAIAKVLFHNLQLACLVIGVACLVLAIGSKIYEGMHKA